MRHANTRHEQLLSSSFVKKVSSGRCRVMTLTQVPAVPGWDSHLGLRPLCFGGERSVAVLLTSP